MKKLCIMLSCMSSLMGMGPAAVNLLKVPANELPFNPFIPRTAWVVERALIGKPQMPKNNVHALNIVLKPALVGSFEAVERRSISHKSSAKIPLKTLPRGLCRLPAVAQMIAKTLSAELSSVKKNKFSTDAKPLVTTKQAARGEFLKQYGATLRNMQFPSVPIVSGPTCLANTQKTEVSSQDVFYECCEPEDVFYDSITPVEVVPLMVDEAVQTDNKEIVTAGSQTTGDSVDTTFQLEQKALVEVATQTRDVCDQNRGWCSSGRACLLFMATYSIYNILSLWNTYEQEQAWKNCDGRGHPCM